MRQAAIHMARSRWLYGAIAVALCMTAAQPAHAQDGGPDLRDLRPFVMMMVDTSGSMELQINCTCSTLSCNECMPDCGAANDGMLRPPQEKKSRWMVTLEALTGEFVDYQCTPLDRTDVNGATYDVGYYRTYGQPWACTTPDGAGDACKAYPPGGGPSGAFLNQTSSGILDQYGERARFGLMTFDGWDTYLGSPPLVDFNDYNRDRAFIQDGLWSYGSFYGSNLAQEYTRPFDGNESDSVAGSAAMRIPGHFKYPNCPTTYQMDTGARGPNAAEGALLSIDTCATPPCSMLGLANKIQEVLLDTRPWGGTPIAAMLEDLYFHLDQENTDSYASCRGTFGVLITDGKPDDDYRKFGCDCYQDVDSQAPGYCGAAGGNDPLSLFCPYMKPEDIARDLVMGRPGRLAQLAELHVIGLSLDDEARAILDEVALQGGTDAVQDVSNQVLLQQSLASIVEKSFSAVTRTVPLFLNSRTPDIVGTRQYEITTGFTVADEDGDPWRGFIERKRYQCIGPDLLPQDLPDESTQSSDRFETQLNGQTVNRTMWTVIPDNPPMPPGVLETGHPLASCGATGTQCKVATFINDAGMFLAPQPITDADLNTGVLPNAQDVIDWMVGEAGSPRDGKRLGDIFHSLPQVIGPPLADRGDAAFNLFRQQPEVRSRSLTMFVNSNDGLIHAFAVEPVLDNLGSPIYKAGEEIWSFVPPVQMRRLKDQLTTHQFLLDGTPTIKDLYMSRLTGLGNNTADTVYKTVLVTGMRGGGNSYIALDVTDIRRPRFLWQFTDPDMGFTYAQPALVQATYDYEVGGGFQRLSRGVAILPGGLGQAADFNGDEPGCDPMSNTNQSYQQQGGMGVFETLTGVGETGTIQHRSDIRCWEGVGRALYFVDIATGRLIKKLHRDSGGNVMFPSPIVGTPVAFSNEVGVEASRAFVTDADGVIWRIDISDNEQQMEKRGSEGRDFQNGWTARPFHDIFQGRGPDAGEVSLPAPILTRDTNENLVVLVGTGDTDNFAKITAENRIVSVAEVLKPGLGGDDPENYQAALNWQLMVQPDFPGFAISELTTGALTLFEGIVYFSSFISVPGADPCDFGKGRMWAVDAFQRGALNMQVSPVTYTPKLFDVYNGFAVPDEQKLVNITQDNAKEDLLLQTPTINEGVSCTVITPSLVDVDFDYDTNYNVASESNVGGFTEINQNLNQEAAPTMMLVAPAAQGGMGGIALQVGGAKVPSVRTNLAKPQQLTKIHAYAGATD